MTLNYFDLIVSIIIILLGLKGIINGFFKELFGLIGIIGGVFVARLIGDEVGQYLSKLIFKFENNAAISFTGFLATLILFWLTMIIIGFIFKKLSSISGQGPLDKIFGFLIGASKFFFIAAIIVSFVYNFKAFKSSIDEMTKNSILFPILVETGSIIIKLDPVEISEDINATTEALQNKAKEAIDKSATSIANDAKEQIKEAMPKVAKEIQIEKVSK